MKNTTLKFLIINFFISISVLAGENNKNQNKKELLIELTNKQKEIDSLTSIINGLITDNLIYKTNEIKLNESIILKTDLNYELNTQLEKKNNELLQLTHFNKKLSKEVLLLRDSVSLLKKKLVPPNSILGDYNGDGNLEYMWCVTRLLTRLLMLIV